MKPYKDLEVADKYILREFSQNIDPIELMWHRDDEGEAAGSRVEASGSTR